MIFRLNRRIFCMKRSWYSILTRLSPLFRYMHTHFFSFPPPLPSSASLTLWCLIVVKLLNIQVTSVGCRRFIDEVHDDKKHMTKSIASSREWDTWGFIDVSAPCVHTQEQENWMMGVGCRLYPYPCALLWIKNSFSIKQRRNAKIRMRWSGSM